jgi:hypothetical protein
MPVIDANAAAAGSPTLVAALIAAIVALSGTVAFLFRHFTKKDDDYMKERSLYSAERAKHAEERANWAAARATLENFENKLRAEYEARYREIASDHSEAVIKMYEDARQLDKENRREYLQSLDETRREYAANIDGVAKRHEESMTKLGAVMDKLAGRLSGRARTH